MTDQLPHTRTESLISTNILVQVRMSNKPWSFSSKIITFIYFSLVLHSFMYFFLLRLFTAALFADSIYEYKH
jgi:hypothetical protein